MLNINPNVGIHICTTPTDMRKSFNGLHARVSDLLEQDVKSGDLFVFLNKNKSMMKILVWQKMGFCIYYKRLEQGSFHLPMFDSSEVRSESVSSSELLLILEGIDLSDSKKYKRFGN